MTDVELNFVNGKVTTASATITGFSCSYENNKATCEKGESTPLVAGFNYIKPKFDWTDLRNRYGVSQECFLDGNGCSDNLDWDGLYDYYDGHYLGTDVNIHSIENLFDTSNVTDMEYKFNNCGVIGMETLDLGPMFTSIPSTNQDMIYNVSKFGCVLKVPASIIADSTHLNVPVEVLYNIQMVL